ncbi:pantetheine-phosphate adenylyltransferase [Helicobacter sp. 23-1045]
MQKIAIYPGTFDPITNGHLDIITRSSQIFDKVIVAVAHSADKSPLFSTENRIKMVNLAISNMPNINAETFDNLLADFASERGCNILIRGLRAVSDFEYELQIGYANASLNPALETIYLMPSLQNAFISSSVVRSILRHNGKIAHLVPPKVNDFIADFIAHLGAQNG